MSELLDMFNARKLGKCPVCKCNEPEKGGFRDDKSLREFGISGLCQKCQDEARVYLRRPLKSNTKTMKYLMGRMMMINNDKDELRQKCLREVSFMLLSLEDKIRAEKAFHLAWEYGHSAGEVEVYNYWLDMKELL